MPTPGTKTCSKILYAAAAGIAGLLCVATSEGTEQQSKAVMQIHSRAESAAHETKDEKKIQAINLESFANNGFDPSIPCFHVDVDCKPHEKKSIPERILDRFGQPESSTSWQKPNRREPVIDEYTSWEYQGLTIITVTSGSPSAWLRSITLTSPHYKLRHGLKIGLPFSEFTKVIGEPRPSYAKRKDTPVYASYWAWVTFKLDSDERVRQVTWDYNVIH